MGKGKDGRLESTPRSDIPLPIEADSAGPDRDAPEILSASGLVRRVRRIAGSFPSTEPFGIAQDEEERIAVAIDRSLAHPEERRDLTEAIRRALPRAGAPAALSRLLAPILHAAAYPEAWVFLREECKEEIGLRIRREGAAAGDETPTAPTLPILIAARDEVESLPRALRSMIPAILEFRRIVPGIDVAVTICDNGSRDGTAEALTALRKELGASAIPLHLLDEPRPGKQAATRRSLDFVDAGPARPSRVVFTDADVEWTPRTLHSLWSYLERRPDIQVVAAGILPRDGSLPRGNVWGVLDTIPFLDFGGPTHDGMGRHFRFLTGMTYMGRAPAVSRMHRRIPMCMANEDVALTILAGRERIAIDGRAAIRYQAARSFPEFRSIKYRHVRGCLQLVDWVASRNSAAAVATRLSARGRDALDDVDWPRTHREIRRAARREADRFVRGVVEIGTLPMIRSLLFERHWAPVQDSHGSISLRRGIPVFLSPTHLAAVVLFMLPVYTAFKIAARRDLRIRPDRRGWQPFRTAESEAEALAPGPGRQAAR